MAGDWIKIEHATPDKPEVVRMALLLRIDQDTVVGKLIRLWAWADVNSVDGEGVRVTDAFIDRLTNKRGFSAALRDAGWLSGDDGNLTLTDFGRHNGASAKARAETNRRVANHRQRNAAGVTTVTSDALQKPLPEKRREENIEGAGAPSEPARPAEAQSAPALTPPRPGPPADDPARTKLPASLDTPAMREAWENWLVHWSQSFGNHRPMPEQTAFAQLRELVAIGPDRAVAAIKNSITKGGLRQPAEPFPTKGPNANPSTGNSRGFSQAGSFAGITDKD